MNDSFSPGDLIMINLSYQNKRNFVTFKDDKSFLYISLIPFRKTKQNYNMRFIRLRNVNELFLINQIAKLEELPSKVELNWSYNFNSTLDVVLITSLLSNIQFLEQYDSNFINSFKVIT